MNFIKKKKGDKISNKAEYIKSKCNTRNKNKFNIDNKINVAKRHLIIESII